MMFGPRRRFPLVRFVAPLTLSLLAVMALIALRTASKPRPPLDLGPRETLRDLTAAGSARDYDRIAALTIRERADGLLETLRAVHAFLDEERRFRAEITHRFGRAFGRTVELAQVADALGPFSTRVKLLDERVEGNRAEVSFLVADTPPAETAVMSRRGDRWLYDPGEGFDPAWPRAFGRMTTVLRELRAELAAGHASTIAIRTDPQAFLAELGKRLSAATEGLPVDPGPHTKNHAPD